MTLGKIPNIIIIGVLIVAEGEALKMEDMIDKLYDLHLNTNSFPLGVPDKETLDEEWKLYAFLYESLPDEYKKAFLRYIELRGLRQNEELKTVYSYGFKTAVKLILESMKE